MALSCEIRLAEWTIPYPKDCNAESVPELLTVLTHVEHDWDSFPWHLAGQLAQHLEQPDASFEYLHLTTFFRARAAMLALNGRILDHADLHKALSKHQVQFGGIYRKLLIRSIRTALTKHNLGQLPECIVHPLEPGHDPNLQVKNRFWIHRVIEAVEIEYVNTLTFISVATAMDEEFSRHSVGFWIKGAEMPKATNVRVRVRRHDGGHDVFPCLDDVKRMMRAGILVQKIAFKLQAEFGLAPAVGGIPNFKKKTSDPHPPPLPSQGEGEDGAKIIGDYRVIRIAGGMQINLATKHKARAFLGFVHRALEKTGQKDFYVEEMREAFNAQYTGEMSGKQWKSDRFREDLFRDKEQEFDLVFESLERGSGYYRMKLLGLLGCILSWWSMADDSWLIDLGLCCLGEHWLKWGMDVVGMV